MNVIDLLQCIQIDLSLYFLHISIYNRRSIFFDHFVFSCEFDVRTTLLATYRVTHRSHKRIIDTVK